MPRNFSKEYKSYHSKPEQIRRRALRNAARRKMIKMGRARKGDGRDVDHKFGISKGNGLKNLRVQSQHANRSYPRTKSGRVKKYG